MAVAAVLVARPAGVAEEAVLVVRLAAGAADFLVVPLLGAVARVPEAPAAALPVAAASLAAAAARWGREA